MTTKRVTYTTSTPLTLGGLSELADAIHSQCYLNDSAQADTPVRLAPLPDGGVTVEVEWELP